MPYFAYMAKQSFKSAPDGTRLFYRGGAWSRPYVLPDGETERRLFQKQLWLYRLTVGPMIAGQPFFLPGLLARTHGWIWFVCYLAFATAAFAAAGRLLFRSDLRTLQRREARLPGRVFLTDTAARHSTVMLALGLLGSLLFVTAGL